MSKIAVIVNHWDGRGSVGDLHRLLLEAQPEVKETGATLAVVVNSETGARIEMPALEIKVPVFYRENTGMNIGAWDHGWRSLPEHELFIFLQDECYIRKPGWLAEYVGLLRDPSVGMVGESLPPKYAIPWEQGFALPQRRRRYLNWYARITKLGIDPGENGLHLQSVIWAARRDTLVKINGFHIGVDKSECLAIEVGVCRAVVAQGLRLVQVGKHSFEWVGHPQWRSGAELAEKAERERFEAQA